MIRGAGRAAASFFEKKVFPQLQFVKPVVYYQVKLVKTKNLKEKYHGT